MNDTMKLVTPATENQRRVFDLFAKGNHLVIHGTAGTGKTFLAMYLALDEVMEKGTFDGVTIIRSAVPTRNLGFLKGDADEKVEQYEKPYRDIAGELFCDWKAYDELKDAKYVEFASTSYLRGLTIDDRVIIVDEIQNMTFDELFTVLTRVGDNSRVIMCGDTAQPDLSEREGRNEFLKMLAICKEMDCFKIVQMNRNDIQRSGFVKKLIVAREKLGL